MARILILTPQLPVPPQALTGLSQGTTIRNFNLIAGLAKRHTLDLLTFRPQAGAEQTAGPGPEVLKAYCREVVVESAPIRSLARRGRDTLLSPLPDMALRLESNRLRGQMARLLTANPYDVIQVEGIEMAPYVLSAGASTGRDQTLPALRGSVRPRLVFDDHNAEYVLQRRAFVTDARQPTRWLAAAYSLVQWRKLLIYERRLCQTADRVVAVSEADADALRRLIPGLEVAVVPNGVDLDFYRPGIVPPMPAMGPHALVFTGKMDYRPNVDAVLWFAQAVLPLIRTRLPDVRFFVVGQQPHARLDPLRQNSAVVLTGRVPDTRPYIAGAGVYVVPLRIGGGTRLKVLEAMAMGQAIVSTRLGCDGFAFEHGREVALADEPEPFAEAVVALLADREQAARLGHASRACVTANFGWDAIVPRLEALYP